MIYLSIVIPCYNESRRLKKNLAIKIEYLRKQTYIWEMVLVDDGSSDNTLEIMKDFIEKNPIYHVKLVVYPKNHGKGYAVRRGMLAAQGEYCLFSDLDNSTPMEELPELLKYSKDYPIVIASRYIKGSEIVKSQTLTRRFVSRLGNLFIRFIIGLNLRDTQCGFKLFSHASAQKIFSLQQSHRWGFDIESLLLAQKIGYQIKEVPVSWTDLGDSKLQPLKASMQVFGEALKSKWNIITNKYNIQ